MTQDQTYRSYVVTAKSSELPVTLERARYQLRNEDLKFDDAHITGLIKTAGDYVERTYGLALLTQTVTQYHQKFPCASNSPLLLRIAPLISVTSITYVDSAGDTQTWNPSEYTSGGYNGRHFITPKTGYSWPSDVDTDLPNAITVTYQAGFGAKASTIPETITQAMLLMITDWYDNRADPVRTMPTASERLMQPFYVFNV